MKGQSGPRQTIEIRDFFSDRNKSVRKMYRTKLLMNSDDLLQHIELYKCKYVSLSLILF